MVGDTGLTTGVADRQWRNMSVTSGIAGLAGLVLVMVSQAFAQAGAGEPAFDAPAAEIQRFFEAKDETMLAVGSYLGLIAVLVLLWFFVGVGVVLRAAELEPAWRSTVAVASGLIFVVLVMSPGWDLAGVRVDEGVDPQIAQLAFDSGNLGFANSWLALAGFLVAAGWIMAGTTSLPRWLGWLAIVTAIGFLLGRAFWTTSIWLIPYALFWIWTVVVSVQLLRGRLRSTPSPAQFDRLGPGME